MKVTHRRLTAAEVRASHGAPVLVVPALGVGKTPLAVGFAISKHITGAQYSAGDDIDIKGGAAGAASFGLTTFDWTDTGSWVAANGVWPVIEAATLDNHGLYFATGVAAVGGSGYVDVYVYWIPIDLV